MNIDFGKFIDWIKLSPRYLIPIFLTSGFLLFAPSNYVGPLGLLEFREMYRSWIGIFFLSSSVLIVTELGYLSYRKLNRKIDSSYQQNALRSLTERQKKILQPYLKMNLRYGKQWPENGDVKELEDLGVITFDEADDIRPYISSGIQAPYEISSWAWEYLKKHPELLD